MEIPPFILSVCTNESMAVFILIAVSESAVISVIISVSVPITAVFTIFVITVITDVITIIFLIFITTNAAIISNIIFITVITAAMIIRDMSPSYRTLAIVIINITILHSDFIHSQPMKRVTLEVFNEIMFYLLSGETIRQRQIIGKSQMVSQARVSSHYHEKKKNKSREF